MNNYSAWGINTKKYPKNADIRKKIKYFTRYGSLAPSLHNTQPWKFRIICDKLIIIPDWKYKLSSTDPTSENLYISLGCCVQNIVCIAAYHGYEAKIHFESKKTLNKIAISFKQDKVPNSISKLAPYITKRFSYKLEFLDKEVEELKITELNKLFADDIAVFSNNKNNINKIATLHKSAVLELSKNKGFFVELGQWLRPNNTKKYDGMPGFSIGMKPLPTLVGKIMLPKLPFSAKILAKKDVMLLKKSPLVGIITSKGNKIEDWVNVGRNYQLVALKVASMGLSMSTMHSVAENKSTSPKLGKILGVKNANIRMFFRIGYGKDIKHHTPRRTINMLIDSEHELAQSMNIDYEINQVKIGKHNINYLKAGKGKPLLLIHGGNIGWGQWYPNIPELSKKFTVYAIDLPGGGRSSRINFSKLDPERDFVGTVEKFCQEMNSKGVNVMGSLIGGWIILRLLIRKNIKINKIILVDSSGFTSYMSFSDRLMGIYPLAKLLSLTLLKPVRSNKNVEKFLRSVFYKKKAKISREFINYFYETMETSHNLLLINSLTNVFGIDKKFILKNSLPNIKNKVLVIWGEQDKLMPLNKNIDTIKLLPNVKIKIVSQAGHIPSMEKSLQFNKIVKNFLK